MNLLNQSPRNKSDWSLLGSIQSIFASAGEKIRLLLRQRQKRDALSKRLPFKFTIDEKAIRQELGSPEDQGAKDGVQGVPLADAVIPSDYEQNVKALTDQENQVLHEKLGRTIALYEAEFNEVSIDDDPASLHAIRRACHEVERPRILDQEKRILQPLKELENQSKSNLSYFKYENKLNRPEESTHWLLSAAILIMIVVIEAVINGFVLKDSQPGGIRGAIALSVAFSIFNVALAFIAGSVLGKNTLHVKQYRKILAWLGLLVMIPLLLAVNGWFASVRAIAEQQHQLNAGITIASEKFVHSPWILIHDPSHLWMLVVGMGFSLLAFWKGMHFTDPYPGYTKVTKQAEYDQLELEKATRQARKRLESHYLAAEKQMKQIAKDNAVIIVNFHADKHEYEILAESYHFARAHLNGVLQSLILSYRHSNMRHRGHRPPPRYFASPVSLGLASTSFTDDQLRSLYKEMGARARHFENKVLADELHYLGELRLFTIRQLDAEIVKILGEPVSDLPEMPEPLRPEVTASLSIQPKDKHATTPSSPDLTKH